MKILTAAFGTPVRFFTSAFLVPCAGGALAWREFAGDMIDVIMRENSEALLRTTLPRMAFSLAAVYAISTGANKLAGRFAGEATADTGIQSEFRIAAFQFCGAALVLGAAIGAGSTIQDVDWKMASRLTPVFIPLMLGLGKLMYKGFWNMRRGFAGLRAPLPPVPDPD